MCAAERFTLRCFAETEVNGDGFIGVCASELSKLMERGQTQIGACLAAVQRQPPEVGLTFDAAEAGLKGPIVK